MLVQEDDCDFQRILWRFSPEESVEDYRLNIVTYSQACASYLAVRCLKRLGEKDKGSYPLASYTLLNTYVDDIISGSNTTENARFFAKTINYVIMKRRVRSAQMVL